MPLTADVDWGALGASRTRWPGTVGTATATPRRRPGSLRRTTSVDIERRAGLDGPVTLTGRARDAATDADGALTVLGAASTRTVVDFTGGRTVTDADSAPHHPEVAGLIGLPASSGFRAAVAAAGASWGTASLVWQLLDEAPVALILSGAAFARAGQAFPEQLRRRLPTVDVCAGWTEDGAMMSALRATGEPAFNGLGPPAAPLAADDPDGWHELDGLAPLSFRRVRRLDVFARPGTTVVEIESMFRDSCFEPDGVETVVHEYSLRTAVSAGLEVLASEAVARVLPGPDCPAAARSVGRIVGRPLESLRAVVASDVTGPSTCTHLNDAFRALSGVAELARRARPARGAAW